MQVFFKCIDGRVGPVRREVLWRRQQRRAPQCEHGFDTLQWHAPLPLGPRQWIALALGVCAWPACCTEEFSSGRAAQRDGNHRLDDPRLRTHRVQRGIAVGAAVMLRSGHGVARPFAPLLARHITGREQCGCKKRCQWNGGSAHRDASPSHIADTTKTWRRVGLVASEGQVEELPPPPFAFAGLPAVRCIETAMRPSERGATLLGSLFADPTPFPFCMDRTRDEKRSGRWCA